MKNEQLISKNKPTNSTQSPGATLQATATATVPLRSAADCVQWFANGASSDVVNFPFALTVSLFLMAGLSAVVWGLFLTSAPLAVVGVAVVLFGSFLCGLSRYER